MFISSINSAEILFIWSSLVWIFCWDKGILNGDSIPLVVKPRSQGWDVISSIPFNEPILFFGFFSSKPLIRLLTSLETTGDLGNWG